MIDVKKLVEAYMLCEATIKFKSPEDFTKYYSRLKEEKAGRAIVRKLPDFAVVLGKSYDDSLDRALEVLKEFPDSAYDYYENGKYNEYIPMRRYHKPNRVGVIESYLSEAAEDRRLNRYLGIDEAHPAYKEYADGRELALALWEVDQRDQTKVDPETGSPKGNGLALLTYTLGRDPNPLYLDAFDLLKKLTDGKAKGIHNPWDGVK